MSSPPRKRKLTSSNRSVSPPSIRRRLYQTAKPSPVNSSTTSDILTFYSWNVNGINPLLQKQLTFTQSALFPLRAFLKHHSWPHLLCLQEVKINRNDSSTQRRVELAANAGSLPNEPTYTTHFSLPRDKFNATGFGGKIHGVATLIRDDIPTLTTTLPDWDLEGRVLIHTFNHLPLTLVNAYWVNGTSNPYHDPNTGQPSGTRHDHKLRFHAHMLTLCNQTLVQGNYVLLLGDMNVAPARIDGHPNLRTLPAQHVKNRADFNDKFLNSSNSSKTDTDDNVFQGIDLFRHFHGELRKYTYRGRGRPWGESADRVDLIISSQDLVDVGAVVDSDICDTPGDRGHSDHVPLWVSVDAEKVCQRIAVRDEEIEVKK